MRDTNFIKLKIQPKLIFLFLILSLVPLGVLFFIANKHLQDSIKENIGARLEETAVQTIDKIDRLFFFVKEDLKSWAFAEAIQDAVTDDPDGRITEYLVRLRKGYGVYAGIFCTNLHGKIIASSEAKSIGLDVSNTPWFKQTLTTARLTISDLRYSKLIHGFSVSFSIPLFASYDETKMIGAKNYCINTISFP